MIEKMNPMDYATGFICNNQELIRQIPISSFNLI